MNHLIGFGFFSGCEKWYKLLIIKMGHCKAHNYQIKPVEKLLTSALWRNYCFDRIFHSWQSSGSFSINCTILRNLRQRPIRWNGSIIILWTLKNFSGWAGNENSTPIFSKSYVLRPGFLIDNVSIGTGLPQKYTLGD